MIQGALIGLVMRLLRYFFQKYVRNSQPYRYHAKGQPSTMDVLLINLVFFFSEVAMWIVMLNLFMQQDQSNPGWK